eukprot:2033403-Amphidinium_carterae.1
MPNAVTRIIHNNLSPRVNKGVWRVAQSTERHRVASRRQSSSPHSEPRCRLKRSLLMLPQVKANQ